MSKYTSGPWEAGKMFLNGAHCWYVHKDGASIVCPIRTGATYDINSTEAEANAHLIAAAPDMLKALVHLLVRMDLRETFDLGDHIAITGARAALTKAKGEWHVLS